jgi:hypothetical protein
MRAHGRTALLRRIPLAARLYVPIAVLFLALFAFSNCVWYATRTPRDPVAGVNFSCKHARYLGLPCEQLFEEVLDDLGVRHVRLSAYWSDIERRPGAYDFSSIDRLLDIALSRDAAVTVTIGMKAQRYPEFWLPGWLTRQADLPDLGYPEDDPLLQESLLAYLTVAARHLGAHPAVEAIQVENEPFVTERRNMAGWTMRHEFVERQIAVVRAADPGRRPIIVNYSAWVSRDTGWQWILDHADVLGQSVYTKRHIGLWSWLYVFPYRWGPLTVNLPRQVRHASERNRAVWITELQAEPFEQRGTDIRDLGSQEARSFSRYRLKANVDLARRSGVDRFYIWGVEWWAYLRDVRGEPELWDLGRTLFSQPRIDAGSAP